MIIKIKKYLIQENIISGIKNVANNIKNLSLIKPISNMNLKKIINYFKTTLHESTNLKVKPAKKLEGHTNMTDTCFTSVMKIIGKEKLLKKYEYSGSVFLDKYVEIAEPVKVNKSNVKNIKSGTVILFWWEKDKNARNGIKLMNNFKNGMLYHDGPMVESAAHFGIIIDPKEQLILHNTIHNYDDGGTPGGIGSHLELSIDKKPNFFNGKIEYYALDMNVIDRM